MADGLTRASQMVRRPGMVVLLSDLLTDAAMPTSNLITVVVNKNGTEAFSDTFAEQLANEKVAQSRGLG